MSHNLSLRKSDDYEVPYLVKIFERFYAELLMHKHEITSKKSFSQKNIQEINQKIIKYLQQQAHEAQRLGGEYTSRFYNEALFIMAALADEIFLNIDWDGHIFWEDNLIEAEFFGTHDAGDLLFKNLEHFLATRDYHRSDIAQIYLMVLGLGFLGKFRGKNDHGKLADYRQRLYHFIYHHDPQLYQGHERIFPDSYMHTPQYTRPRAMQDKRLWHSFFLIVFFIILFMSHCLWSRAICDIENLASSIIDTYDQI